ncbi:MAG: DUF4115 domain-containing protein [Cyanobacteria bacterium P01_E01_bin.42]
MIDDCWLKVIADGKVLYQGTLASGEQKVWQAKEKITMVAGNAGGVLISINGQEAKSLGTPGAVETATFIPPDQPFTPFTPSPTPVPIPSPTQSLPLEVSLLNLIELGKSDRV